MRNTNGRRCLLSFFSLLLHIIALAPSPKTFILFILSVLHVLGKYNHRNRRNSQTCIHLPPVAYATGTQADQLPLVPLASTISIASSYCLASRTFRPPLLLHNHRRPRGLLSRTMADNNSTQPQPGSLQAYVLLAPARSRLHLILFRA